MRKFIFTLCVLFGFMPVAGFAGFRVGGSGMCAVDTDGRDWFWYCGDQDKGCAGTKDRARDHRVWLVGVNQRDYPGADWSKERLAEGDPSGNTDWAYNAFSWEGKYYACCGGTKSGGGQLTYYDKWEQTKTKELDNSGQCSYKVTPCGNPIEPECFFADTCTDTSKKLRVLYIDDVEDNPFDSRCVEPCVFPYAYTSVYSDVCIECSTTTTSGIDSQGVCVQCDSSSEFFIMPTDGCLGRKGGHFTDGNNQEVKYTGCCVKKAAQPKAIKPGLAACFRCPLKPGVWKNCLEGKLSPDELKSCGLKAQIDSGYQIGL